MLKVFKKKDFHIPELLNEGNAFLCKVLHIHISDTWFLLNVYAPNSTRERRVFWENILDVIQSSNINKCIIIWDFNAPLLDDEKLGGLALDQDSKLDLSNFINRLDFMDVDLLEVVIYLVK